jgi:hypothetical protein
MRRSTVLSLPLQVPAPYDKASWKIICDKEKRLLPLMPGVNVINLFSFITDDEA